MKLLQHILIFIWRFFTFIFWQCMLNSSSFDFRLHFSLTLTLSLTVVYNLRIWRNNFTWRWIVATRKYWRFTEDQAFLPSYHLAPPPPPPCLSRRHTGRLRKKKRDNLLMGEEEGWGCGGAKSYDGGKAWPSINHSKLSGSSPIAFMKIMRIIQWWNIVHVVTVMFFKKIEYKIQQRTPK